jgi:hypothetical protein
MNHRESVVVPATLATPTAPLCLTINNCLFARLKLCGSPHGGCPLLVCQSLPCPQTAGRFHESEVECGITLPSFGWPRLVMYFP